MIWLNLTDHKGVQKRRAGRLGRMALGLGLIVAAAGVQAQVAPTAGALSCLVEPSFDARIGTAVEGVLAEVSVDRSDVVRAGQVLARLNSGVERASVDYQNARVAYATRRVERSAELRANRLISAQEVDELETERTLARHELQERREALRLREVRAPVDGVIVERYRNVGDLVQRDEVFRLLRLHPLYVEVVLPVTWFGQVSKGQTYSVRLHHLQSEHEIKVVNVDRVIDPSSNTFRVRLELPNPDLSVPSGLRCDFLTGPPG